jgi:hypothetical protein
MKNLAFIMQIGSTMLAFLREYCPFNPRHRMRQGRPIQSSFNGNRYRPAIKSELTRLTRCGATICQFTLVTACIVAAKVKYGIREALP